MTLFAINETEIGWEEVAAAAQCWGDWQPFVVEIRASLACLRYAAATGQGLSAQAVKEDLTAFRYAHNLISADETRLWLNRWQMSFEELSNYLRGTLLRQKWADRLEEIVAAHPIGDQEVTAVLKHYAICAGKLGEWALKLAGHAAIAAKSGSFDAGGQSQRPLAPRDLVACIETEFERERRQTITPKLIETKIADHRLDWVRFDCQCLWFADERIAREAVWCVTEDGLTLEEVAASAHAEIRGWNFYLDEIEAGMRPHFLAARQGDLLGPLKLQDGFPLFSIAVKQMPAAEDAQICARAEQAILRGWMEQAINERVTWY